MGKGKYYCGLKLKKQSSVAKDEREKNVLLPKVLSFYVYINVTLFTSYMA